MSLGPPVKATLVITRLRTALPNAWNPAKALMSVSTGRGTLPTQGPG